MGYATWTVHVQHVPTQKVFAFSTSARTVEQACKRTKIAVQRDHGLRAAEMETVKAERWDD